MLFSVTLCLCGNLLLAVPLCHLFAVVLLAALLDRIVSVS